MIWSQSGLLTKAESLLVVRGISPGSRPWPLIHGDVMREITDSEALARIADCCYGTLVKACYTDQKWYADDPDCGKRLKSFVPDTVHSHPFGIEGVSSRTWEVLQHPATGQKARPPIGYDPTLMLLLPRRMETV